MPPTDKAAWRIALESYPCQKCNAPAGSPCRNLRTGWPVHNIHAARTNDAGRCQKCGIRIEADRVMAADALCARCALVRALEVERATKYRRTD